MRPEQRKLIHDTVLKARDLLEEEIASLLEGTYGLHEDGILEEAASLPALKKNPEASLTRQALEYYLAEQEQAGETQEAARASLIKETAFTHLNRLVALRMMEVRDLIRGTVNKGLDSNQFKHWLAGDDEGLKLFQEGEKDRAYRLFLSSVYSGLSGEIKVLFDPDTLPSRLSSRPSVLDELLALLNAEELEPAWAEDEAIGWVYQYFNEEENESIKKSGIKVPSELVGSFTQKFTPRWIVEYLVQNTLGRLWINMHPDTRLKDKLPYLVPMQGEQPAEPLRRAKDITLLDPACGTMHFGLVAFDFFYEMYAEELDKAGQKGWTDTPSVSDKEDIPSSIIAHNLYGADIDLRAVQLSALSLFLKAKTKNRNAQITSSNLACAEVLPLDGDKLDQFIEESTFSHPIIPKLLCELWPSLKQTSYLGSLARIEKDINNLIERERSKAEKEKGKLFGEDLEEALPVEEAFWQGIEAEILAALDSFAVSFSPEAYFAQEAERGIRLLDVLRRHYDVVVTNPPYLDSRDSNNDLKGILGKQYPQGKRNLFSAFTERCLEITRENGRLGILTPHVFMFISTYESFREELYKVASTESLLHMGYKAFEYALVDLAAYILRKEPDASRRDASIGTYFRVVKAPDKQAALEHSLATGDNVYHLRQSKIRTIPGHPWVYWIPDSIRELFEKLPKLGDIAQPRQGLATADNFRFLHFWWESGRERIAFGCKDKDQAIATGAIWFPYMKGGSFRKWYGNQEYIVNWLDNGKEMRAFAPAVIRNPDYYFREGVTWSDLSQKGFGARYLPTGFIFDVKGSSGFPPSDESLYVASILNSDIASYSLGLLNPTVSFQVGDIARIPIVDKPDKDKKQAIDSLASTLISLRRLDSTEDDTTYDFIAPLPWADGIEIKQKREEEIARLEAELDELVYDLYGIFAEDRKLIEKELSERETVSEEGDEGAPAGGEEEEAFLTREELAFRWVSYAVGIVLGRFSPGKEGELGSAIVEDEEGEKKHLFTPEVEEKLRSLADPDGICVLDPGHPDDLPAKVEEALSLMLGEEGESEVADTLGGDSRKYLSRTFFPEHAKLYRRRPCYWLLATEKKNYGFYLFCERVDKDTLFKIKTNYLGPKLNLTANRLQELKEKASSLEGKERRAADKEMEQLEALLSEVEDFADKLDKVIAQGYDPHPDDGVLINLSPLRGLIPWPKKGELEKVWKELSSGSYDWSHMAMCHWPQRVKEKCQKDKSLRIAHGME